MAKKEKKVKGERLEDIRWACREVMPNDFVAAVNDIKLAILQARARAAQASNVEALKLYFFVGGYISKKTRSAKWGTGAIHALSERLQVELPGLRGFSPASIRKMRLFFEAWMPFFEIRSLPTNELTLMPVSKGCSLPTKDLNADSSAFLAVGFTHHVAIFMSVKGVEDRLYYIRKCAREHLNVIELGRALAAKEHLHVGALPNNFAKTLPMVQATKAVRSFRDEYLLELVNLDNVDAVHDQDVDERVLSKGLVANIEKTIAALGGNDFCFMGREKRLIVEGEELFIDLLFYHRALQAMVAIELKMGKFRASYLGQLSQYLSVLDATERKPYENPSVGLLLCEQMSKPVVQLTVQGYSQPIGIATYQALNKIPEPYKTLAPVIDGVRRLLVEEKNAEKKAAKKGRRK